MGQVSGACAYCYEPNATVGVGENEHGDELFVHQRCQQPYVERVLGRTMIDMARRRYGQTDDSQDAGMAAAPQIL